MEHIKIVASQDYNGAENFCCPVHGKQQLNASLTTCGNISKNKPKLLAYKSTCNQYLAMAASDYGSDLLHIIYAIAFNALDCTPTYKHSSSSNRLKCLCHDPHIRYASAFDVLLDGIPPFLYLMLV